jgi:hypothetical protein
MGLVGRSKTDPLPKSKVQSPKSEVRGLTLAPDVRLRSDARSHSYNCRYVGIACRL